MYYFPGADGISTKGLCIDNNNTKDGNSVITVYIWSKMSKNGKRFQNS